MIYITGDCHGDFRRFSSKIFPEQKEMTRDDFVIICGDFGGIWNKKPFLSEENYWLNWLNDKPFTTLFVDGNHENFNRLRDDYSLVDYHGGKANQIRENIFHLERGYVFEIDGKSIFAFGGASSHDIDDGILDPDSFNSITEFRNMKQTWDKQYKRYRIKNVSWWEEELPSPAEMQRGIENLNKVNNTVDFVVTHCAPQEICSIMSAGTYEPDILTLYFNGLLSDLKFSKWFFGHYHENRQIMGKFIEIYEQIIQIN